MKTKKIAELMDNYLNIVVSMKKEIKSILKANNNIIEFNEDDEEFELPSVMVEDMNDCPAKVYVVGVELDNDEIYIKGIEDYGDEESPSYIAENNMLYEILEALFCLKTIH